MASSSQQPPKNQFNADQNKKKNQNVPTLILKPDEKVNSKIKSLSLIGKVISNRETRVSVVKKIVVDGWKPLGKVDAHNMGVNLFMFAFKKEEDFNKTLRFRTWSVLDKHIVLKRWNQDLDLAKVDFSTSPVWVQVHHVPIGLRTVPNAFKIGEMFNHVEQYWFSLDEEGIWKEVLRFKVHLKVEEQLLTGFQIPNEDGSFIDVEFKYERLGDLCYKCDIMGHDIKECEDKNTEGLEGKFGPWLRAEYRGKLKPETSLGTKSEIHNLDGAEIEKPENEETLEAEKCDLAAEEIRTLFKCC